MARKVSLQLTTKAAGNLQRLSQQLGLNPSEFASLCFEYVDISHQGIVAAAQKIKQGKQKPSINKNNLNQHLQQLSSDQIELLLTKAAQKRKS